MSYPSDRTVKLVDIDGPNQPSRREIDAMHDMDIAYLGRKLASLEATYERRISELEYTVRCLQDKLDALQAAQQAVPAKPAKTKGAGVLPARADIDDLNCQIWHSPNLTPKERQAHKTTWSLKFEFEREGQDKRAVNMGLYTRENFLKHKAVACINMPQTTRGFVDQMGDGDLVGMVRFSPIDSVTGKAKKGTSWQQDQIAIMWGHDADKPTVMLLIGDDVIEFTRFGPSKPGEGASKWFAKWDLM